MQNNLTAPVSITAQVAEDALQRYVHERDPEAFELLVRRYQGMVYAACRRHLSVSADVEDAVQETFLKLARKAEMIRTNLSAWLYTTAIHTASNAQRRSQTRERYEREVAENAEPTQNNPQQEPTWRQLGPEIDRALQALSDSDRQLLTERFLMGRSATELAEELNVSRVTLHKRQNRAIELLRHVLAQRGVLLSAAGLLAALSSVPAEAAPPITVTASLMKIGLAGVGSGSGSAATIATGGGMTVAHKGLLTAGAVMLLGGAVVSLLVADETASQPTHGQPNNTNATPATSKLPDPAVAGTWTSLSYNGAYDIFTFSGERIDAFQFEGPRENNFIHFIAARITDIHPDAEPATLDTYEAPEPKQIQIGQYGRGIYTFHGDEVELYVSFGLNEAIPERPPAFNESAAINNYLHVRLRKLPQPIKHPTLGTQRTPAKDPRLTGDWRAYGWLNIAFTPDGKSLITRIRSTGDLLSELKILRWEPNITPPRIEGIYVQHEQKRMIGRTQRLIYDVTGDQLKLASYDMDTEKANLWPRTLQLSDQLEVYTYERLAPADK